MASRLLHRYEPAIEHEANAQSGKAGPEGVNRARDQRTLEVVRAEWLWGRTDVDREAFLCASCDLQVFPASFDVANQKRPYFTKPKSREHAPECEVVEYDRLVERARRTSVATDDGDLPVSYPNRLRNLEGADPQRAGEGVVERLAIPGQAGRRLPGHAPRRRRYPAGSLHLICQTFIDFPHDRERLDLQIDGVEGRTYDAIFKHLERNRIVPQSRPRLFYAPIKLLVSPSFTDAEARFSVDCGENRRTTAERLYEVRLQWEGWSQTDRARLEAEIKTTRAEVRAAWTARMLLDHSAWAFFLGEQSPSTHAAFNVRDPRAICCLFSPLIFPNRGPRMR